MEPEGRPFGSLESFSTSSAGSVSRSVEIGDPVLPLGPAGELASLRRRHSVRRQPRIMGLLGACPGVGRLPSVGEGAGARPEQPPRAPARTVLEEYTC